MDLSSVPPALVEKYGLSVFQAGLDICEHRRKEYRFNHPTPVREIQPLPQLLPQQPAETTGQVTQVQQPEWVKFWPLLMLKALQVKHSGAIRVYFLARALDVEGQGKVERVDLLDYLKTLKVDTRQRQRWLRDALDLGLFVSHRKKDESIHYEIIGLSRAAIILGCEKIGRPAGVPARRLVRMGWRAYVWAGYLTTLRERPVSQVKKAAATGVDERTQRNYQKSLGNRRGNFSRTNYSPDHIGGLQEINGFHLIKSTKGRGVYQKLPDIRTVPVFAARMGLKGRSRKVQKLINATLYYQVRGWSNYQKLFTDDHKQTKALHKQIGRSDTPPWEIPDVTFELQFPGQFNNLWSAVPTGAACAL